MIVPSSTRSWLGILKYTFSTNSSCQVFLLSERIVSYKYGVLIRLTYRVISDIKNGTAF